MKSLALKNRFILLTRLQEAIHTKNLRHLGLMEVIGPMKCLGVQHVADFKQQPNQLDLTKIIVKAQEKAIIKCDWLKVLIRIID